MDWPIAWQIGWRYTRATRRTQRNTFISFISGLSMAGIGLGVAALIVVLSVMNGFQTEVRDRMLSALSHIEVFAHNAPPENWDQVSAQIKQHPSVKAVAPFIQAQGMLTVDDNVRGVLLRGVSPEQEPQVAEMTAKLRSGQLTDLKTGEFNIVLGIDLARALGVGMGGAVTVVVPSGTVTPAGVLPRLRSFKVVGLLESGHFEYDSALALIHLDDAQRLLRLDGPGGLRVRLNNMHQAPFVAGELRQNLSGFIVRDWSQQNKSWFSAVQTEKRMMFIILALIIAVAAFNLVSTLVMTVTDKQGDIAILRAMGAGRKTIMSIFIVQGTVIGLLGTLFGTLGGSLLASYLDVLVPALEHLIGVQFLPRDIYFINSLPSELRSGDVVAIASMACVLSVLATLYPSWRAACVRPAEALRYE